VKNSYGTALAYEQWILVTANDPEHYSLKLWLTRDYRFDEFRRQCYRTLETLERPSRGRTDTRRHAQPAAVCSVNTHTSTAQRLLLAG